MLQGTPSALLTIGSTSFTPLINAILSPTSLSALISIGIKSILLQIGNSTLPSDWNEGSRLYIADADGDGVIRVEVVRFIDELESRVGAFELVISHAGAGSILSFIRPSPDHPITKAQRQLILIPNSTLMDSHQVDLADQFFLKGWAKVATVANIAETIKSIGLLTNDPVSPSLTPLYPAYNPNNISKILRTTLT